MNTYVVYDNMNNLSNYTYTNFNYITYLIVGFVYFYFLSLVVDKYLKIDKLEKTCDTKDLDVNSTKYKTKQDLCKVLNEKYNNTKFVYMLVLGMLSITAGGYLVRSNPRYLTSGLGVSLGGFIAIVYYTVLNWSRFGRNYQLLVLGSTLFVMVYGSVKTC